MIKSMFIAIICITGLVLGWAVIQNMWRKNFGEMITDEDVLADRRSCKSCNCEKPCPNKSIVQ